MSHIQAFERDVTARQLRTVVVETGLLDGKPFAVLGDTLFFPESGGQPADRGTLGGVPVTHVIRNGATILHFLAAPVALGPVELELDWRRRFDHMQQHSAQHLLTALAHERLGWPTTAFHLGESVSDIDLDIERPDPEALTSLAEAAAEAVRRAIPITSRRVPAADLQALAVRSRGLPEGHSGSVRLVEIAGLDCNTCGGTHVNSTAELEAVVLLGTEPMHGGTRLYFAAGGRVRRRLEEHERRNALLRTALGVPDSELVELVSRKLGQLRDLERQLCRRDEQLGQALARELATCPPPLAEAHFPDEPPAFVQMLARQLAAHDTAAWTLLTASGGGCHSFAVVAPVGAAGFLADVGADAAAAFEGRGGGTGRVFQGKATHLKARAGVLAILRAAGTGHPPPGSRTC